jgi:hypothetical protein
MAIGGLSSGDFRLSNSALRILYSVIKDTIPSVASDALTQNNPAAIAGQASSTIPTAVKKGVLGGTVAFTRPDAGANVVGGPPVVSGSLVAPATGKCRPLGLFITDAVGNAFENTPGIASGKVSVLRGGSCGVKLYETKTQGSPVTGAPAAGVAVNFYPGDWVYGSVNGLVTTVWQDSLEAWLKGASAVETDCTRLGVVLSGPDSTSAEVFMSLFL